MYAKVVPALNKIAAKNGVSPILVPKCYYVDSDEGVMAMEDLKEIGFGIQGKQEGRRTDFPYKKNCPCFIVDISFRA